MSACKSLLFSMLANSFFFLFFSVDTCASVKCGFYSECDIMNGSATCVCPGSGSRPSCSSEKDPVCGSDGVIYDNICHLKNASCVQQMMITPSLLGKCGKISFVIFPKLRSQV